MDEAYDLVLPPREQSPFFAATQSPPVSPLHATSRWHQLALGDFFETASLQSAHRFATLSLFLLIAAVSTMALHKPHLLAIALAFIAGDIGFVSALLARRIARQHAHPTRQAVGAALFNALLLTLPIALLAAQRTNLLKF